MTGPGVSQSARACLWSIPAPCSHRLTRGPHPPAGSGHHNPLLPGGEAGIHHGCTMNNTTGLDSGGHCLAAPRPAVWLAMPCTQWLARLLQRTPMHSLPSQAARRPKCCMCHSWPASPYLSDGMHVPCSWPRNAHQPSGHGRHAGVQRAHSAMAGLQRTGCQSGWGQLQAKCAS